MNKQLLKGHSKLLILSALQKRPMHGYALSEYLQVEMAESFKFGVGMMYPILHKLEKDGLIEGKWEGVSGLSKRVYHLTKKGKKELAIRTKEWTTMSHLVNSLLNQAYV